MLDRSRYADRDVAFRRDDLAGLADLIVVRRIAGVDRGAAGADRRAELVGERVYILMELLRRSERAAARDDDLGAGQLGPLGRRDLGADKVREAGIAAAGERLDYAVANLVIGLLERCAADGEHLLGIRRLDRGDGVAG